MGEAWERQLVAQCNICWFLHRILWIQFGYLFRLLPTSFWPKTKNWKGNHAKSQIMHHLSISSSLRWRLNSIKRSLQDIGQPTSTQYRHLSLRWDRIGGTHPHGDMITYDWASYIYHTMLCYIISHTKLTHNMPAHWSGTRITLPPASPIHTISMLPYPCYHIHAAVVLLLCCPIQRILIV